MKPQRFFTILLLACLLSPVARAEESSTTAREAVPAPQPQGETYSFPPTDIQEEGDPAETAPPNDEQPPETTGESPAEPPADQAEEPAVLPEGTGIITGQVLERGTKKPVAFAQVVVEEAQVFEEADEKGRFTLAGLPAGSFTVIVTSVGYENLSASETLKVGEKVDLRYYLDPEIYGMEEIVVRSAKNRTEVSRQVVSKAELKSMPGSGGDPVRAIENLPGVGDNATTAGLVIRGSGREDSHVYLDGHYIPILFHFGGFKSVYNADLLKDIEVLLGGFGVQQGGAIGGIVNLRTRDIKTDRWQGYVDTSMLDITAMAEGPVGGEDKALALSARYSVIQYIMQGIDFGDSLSFTTYPNYYDFVASYQQKLNPDNDITTSIYGARDAMEVYTPRVNENEPMLTGNAGFDSSFYTWAFTWNHRSGDLENRFSPAFRYVQVSANVGSDITFSSDVLELEVLEDLSLTLSGHHRLNMGFKLDGFRYGIDANIIRPPKEGEIYITLSDGEFYQVRAFDYAASGALYLEDVMSYGPVEIIPGLRVAGMVKMGDSIYVDPRLAVRWKVVKPLTLKASAGWYHQSPTPDELVEPFGNPDLKPEGAVQTSLGLEWAITDDIDLNVEGFYKYLHDLAVVDDEVKYRNQGKGYIWGVEVLLRHKLTRNFFGWLAYSYQQSRRKDQVDDSYRPFDEDVAHSLTLVLSYKFCKTWQVGTRLQFRSGYPYTPIAGGVYLADSNTYAPIYDAQDKNSRRLPYEYQWDLRLDKQFVFDTWMLSLYLDVQNVTLADRVIAVNYRFDYRDKGYLLFLPILPSLGLRADF